MSQIKYSSSDNTTAKKEQLIQKCLDDPNSYLNNIHILADDEDRPMFSGQEIMGLNEMAAVIEQERNKSSQLMEQ